MIHRIEVNFAIPVETTDDQLHRLHDIIAEITRANVPAGHVHWVSGYGDKPMWSQADARFLGLSVADDAPAAGEPSFDDTVFHIETTCREAHPNELKGARADAPPQEPK